MKSFVCIHKFKKKQQSTKIIAFQKKDSSVVKPGFTLCSGESGVKGQADTFLMITDKEKGTINVRRVIRNKRLIWSYGFIIKPKTKKYYCALNFISEI